MLTRKQFLQSIVLAGCGIDRDRRTSPDAAPADASPDDPDADVCVRGRCTQPDATPHDAPPAGVCSSTSALIGDNHGHAVTVPEADVVAGVEKTYDIRGISGHPHAITITAAMFATLRTHTSITVTSTEVAEHVHDVVVTCAA